MIPFQLILAIIMIESSGNEFALNKKEQAYGCLQIREAYCKDASEQSHHDWSHREAFDAVAAIQMFEAYMQRYATTQRLGRDVTAEDIARIHNGGPNGYKRSSTDAYWAKVKQQLLAMGATDLANGKTIKHKIK
jgi:hypothetical protein